MDAECQIGGMKVGHVTSGICVSTVGGLTALCWQGASETGRDDCGGKQADMVVLAQHSH